MLLFGSIGTQEVALENGKQFISKLFGGRIRKPVLQFEVPIFRRALSWKPTLEQIRQELAKSYPDLRDEEISRIIRACVSCEEREKVVAKERAR